jgi:hypothetical protein
MSGASEYLVVCEGDPDSLEAAVRQAMAAGWNPRGGVAVCYEPPAHSHDCRECQCNEVSSYGAWTWAQAMVRGGPA